MTTLLEQYAVWWPARCGPAVALTNSKTATQVYNGTDRPDFWIASLGMVNLGEAQRVLVVLIKDAADNQGAGDLKTRIAALSESDNDATLHEHRLWLKNRKKAGQTENDLEMAFYRLVCVLLNNKGMTVAIPFELIVTYLMDVLSQDVATVRTSMYVTLRNEVPESVWKGPYT